jgi:malonate transporter
VLNRFVAFLALPALLFEAMTLVRMGEFNDFDYLVAAFAGIVGCFVLALFFARRGRRGLAASSVQALDASYSNAGFMGIPLCRAAFGDASLTPAILITILTAVVIYGITIVLIEIDINSDRNALQAFAKVGISLVRNPLVIAPALGLLVALVGVPVPPVVTTFIQYLGNASTPCALVCIGLFIGERRMTFAPIVLARLVLLKLLAQPLVAALVILAFPSIPALWGKTAILMSALPTGTGPFILSRLYGFEEESTSSTILVSTVLSFASVSVLLHFLLK